jgi:putative copper export protein
MYRLLIILHILGATIWVGGHLVLSLTILPRALRERDPAIIRQFEEGYERIGIPALIIQVLTGLILAFHWAPDVGSWFQPSTFQASLITVKLGLLAMTVALAAHARLKIIPSLDSNNLRKLGAHIIAVTTIGVIMVVLGVAIRTGGLW